MKKVLAVMFLSISFCLLSACKESDKISVVIPFGSPQFAQIYMQDNDAEYTVKTLNGADLLPAEFNNKEADIIFAPTNLGAKLYNDANSPYIIIASVIWGNYYFVSQSEITDIKDLNYKEVYLFGRGNVPDIISQYVLTENDVNTDIKYLPTTADTAAAVTLDKESVYLIAEPQVSVLNNNPDYSFYTIDVQKLYAGLNGNESYPQASVFVNRSLDDSGIKKILTDLEDSITKTKNNPAEAAAIALSLGIGSKTTGPDIMQDAIKNSNVAFKSAILSKPALISFFEVILESAPALIGSRLPDNDFYYS